MGLRRENGGYSATVEGYFVFRGERIRLAKTNGRTFVFAQPCELAPGTTGELLVIVDGKQDSKLVVLPNGVASGQPVAEYEVVVPF
jgi:hypothetical protein